MHNMTVADQTSKTSPSIPQLNGNAEPDFREAIAIVGFSFKFPQDGTSVDSFWDMLVQGRNASTEIPVSRMRADAFTHPNGRHFDKFTTDKACFLEDDIASFDAPFFSISNEEAQTMDPQQRALLETTYRAFENSGLPMEKVSGSKTSVFVGNFTDDYKMMYCKDPEQSFQYGATGCLLSVLSSRLSWFFNLTGQSFSLDSACSSSLTAVDLACQNLISKESDMSVVGASNMIFSPDMMLLLSSFNVLSSQGTPFVFDQRANGYTRGEGHAVLILKRLKDALRDGDCIRAVIRSSGCNQDGHSKNGIAQPSRKAQEALIRHTYQKAGLDLGKTMFVEAHGTGTKLGDAVEVNAIGNSFKRGRSTSDELYVGALKSNIGHLEGCSGLAGLIKAVLVLERGIIPPNVSFEKPNIRIDADFLKIKFPLQPTLWPKCGLRRASVNSFGIGGSNAHVVIDDAYHYLHARSLTGRHNTTISPSLCINGTGSDNHENDNSAQKSQIPHQESPKLLVLSGADEIGTCRWNDLYKAFFTKRAAEKTSRAETYLQSLAFTLSSRRSMLPWRSFAVISSLSDLTSIDVLFSKPCQANSTPPKLGFVFTGQGAQWPRMGVQLQVYPTFQESIQDSDSFLTSIGCSWRIQEELSKPIHTSSINKPKYSQPLCTVIQIAIVDLLRSFRIFPTAVVGHSSGEIAAAYCAGSISKESALRIAYFRGLHTSSLSLIGCTPGAMLAVALSVEKILPLIDEVSKSFDKKRLWIACFNSKTSLTISGDKEQIEALELLVKREKGRKQRLNVDVAYHSPHMESIMKVYADSIDTIEAPRDAVSRPPTMISSVTGATVSAEELQSSEYWIRNLVSPVKFVDALTPLCEVSGQTITMTIDLKHKKSSKVDFLIEVGPHAALRGPVREILEACSSQGQTTYLSTMTRGLSAADTLLNVAGHLHCAGYEVDFAAINNPNIPTDSLSILTDLPEYPFDHSTSYWLESRLSKNLRFPHHGHDEFLGKPVPDWNPLDARWRSFISTTSLPWTVDHEIQGQILYPAAGMLVMALEAARQLAGSSDTIRGYMIKNAAFHTPLIIPPKRHIETQISLRPESSRPTLKNQMRWFSFKIFSFPESGAVEHSHGTVAIEYSQEINGVDGDRIERGKRLHYQTLHSSVEEACTHSIAPADLYNRLLKAGYNYGPRFQALKTVNHGPRAASCMISESGDNIMGANIIHPATLDAFMQVLLVANLGEEANVHGLKVPSSIKNLWISSKLSEANEPSKSFRASALLNSETGLTSEGNVCVFDLEGGDILAKLEGLKATLAKGAQSSDAGVEGFDPSTSMCRRISWKPDITLLSNEELSRHCKKRQTSAVEPVEEFEMLDCFLYLAISKISSLLEETDTLPSKNVANYANWICEQVLSYNVGAMPNFRPEWRKHLDDKNYFENLCSKVQENSRLGRLCLRIWSSMPQILSGDVDPLSLLFQDDLLSDTYQELHDTSGWLSGLEDIAAHLGHLNGGMRILEVGAGTGATARVLLKSLSTTTGDDMRYSRYDYTDISSGFFVQAQENFKDFRDVNFLTLDIEQDPGAQGFELGSYDLVVASLVLHATRNLTATLAHVRSLLRPGGKLILLEFLKPDLPRFAFSMALLPGWWLSSEDFRRSGPLISGSKWNELLISAGFSGNDIELNDFEIESCKQMSLILSTATERSKDNGTHENQEIVLFTPENESTRSDISKVSSHLLQSGFIVVHADSLEEAASVTGKDNILLFMVELFVPFLARISPEDFKLLQSVLQNVQAVFWVTKGDGDSPHPDYSLIDGLSRVLRNENSHVPFVTIAFDVSTQLVDYQVEKLVAILQKTLGNSAGEHYESAFVESNGVMEIGRIIPDGEASQASISRISKSAIRRQKYSHADSLRLCHEVGSAGQDSFYFSEQERHGPLGPAEVEVKVQAFGLHEINLPSASSVSNGFSLADTCAGIVTRVGKDCTNIRPGDRVFGWGTNLFKSRVHLNQACVAKVPKDTSLPETACLLLLFLTAIHMLRLIPSPSGQSILIHSAADSVGQATIQMSRILGISEIFITVGSVEEKSVLMDQYVIPERNIFFSGSTDFTENIKRVRPVGIDIIVNTLSGDARTASWECLAPFGHFVDLTKDESHLQPRANISYTSVDMRGLLTHRQGLLMQHFQTLVDLLETEKLQKIGEIHVYKVDEVGEAFKELQSGRSHGGIAIEADSDALVPVAMPTRLNVRLDNDKSYIIAGGLGGIGQMVARWMVEQGARFLILVSRSGPAGHDVADFLKEMRDAGVTVQTPTCDISDLSALENMLKQCSTNMPPIRGCIQASMVLEDSLFSSMPFSSWESTLAPKVRGSWNLHTLLPSDLDFFILFSSVCGIFGQVGQANYAAGNTYEDTLARYRTSLGYRNSFAFDLGIMGEAGWLARHEEVTQRLMATGQFVEISKEHLYGLLDHCINDQRPQTPNSSVEKSQIVVGLKAPDMNLSNNSKNRAPLFNHLYQSHHSTSTTNSSSSSLAPDLANLKTRFLAASSKTPADAALVVAHALRAKLTQFLSSTSASSLVNHDIDIFQPLLNYGIDSLLGVELRNWLAAEFAADVAIFEIMGGASCRGIGESVVRESKLLVSKST